MIKGYHMSATAESGGSMNLRIGSPFECTVHAEPTNMARIARRAQDLCTGGLIFYGAPPFCWFPLKTSPEDFEIEFF